MTTYLITSAGTAAVINILLQKISPSFAKISFSRLILDLNIATISIGLGIYLSLGKV